MKTRQLDVCFVSPGEDDILYQDLNKKLTSIEPNPWCLLLAKSCQIKGFGCAIVDCSAERLSTNDAAYKIQDLNPRLVCIISFGSNPNASTMKMYGTIKLSDKLKEVWPQCKICVGGSHGNALPKDVLQHNSVDFVLLNEGVYALHNLLRTDLNNQLNIIKGIGRKENGGIVLNEPERIVPQELLPTDLPPGGAYELLPYKNKPFDLYRSCNWHVNFDESKRTPYCAIYTSLGCWAKCNFCIINILNRTNNDEGVVSSHSNIMRFWPTDLILQEFDKLAKLGVTNTRILDEMFLSNRKYYEPLCQGLSKRDYKLCTWAYSRCDTVNEKYLDLVRQAGINYLALGIESGRQDIRIEASKGSFKDVNIRSIVSNIRNCGINVIQNFIVGLIGETYDSMVKTKELAFELNTEMLNVYTAMPLPGSQLYYDALEKKYKLPQSYDAWSFHSYNCEPTPTEYLTSKEILRFRDDMWQEYFSRPEYLNLIESKFGLEQRKNVEEMTKIKLRRKLLEN